MLQLFLHFIQLLLFLLFFAGCGLPFFVSRIKLGRFFEAIFLSTLLGCFLFTALFAIYCTTFKSVFSILLILVIYIFAQPAKMSLSFSKHDYRELKIGLAKFGIPILFSLALLFVWSVQLLYDANFVAQLPANPESLLYAQFSKIVSATGVESTFNIGLLPQSIARVVSPYHYFDLWFTAATAKTLSILELEALHCITNPCFNFIALLGLCALFEFFSKPKWHTPFLVLLLLFVSGCNFVPFMDDFGQYNFDYLESPMMLYGEKLSFALCLALLGILLFLRNHHFESLAILLLMPSCFPTLLPPVVLAFPLMMAFTYKSKLFKADEIKNLFLLYFCVIAAMLLLYAQFGASKITNQSPTDFNGFNWPSIKLLVAEFVFRTWAKPFRSLLFYLPFILIFLFAPIISETESLRMIILEFNPIICLSFW